MRQKVKRIVRSVINFLITSGVRVCFALVLSRLIRKKWQTSTLAQWNKRNELLSCFFCHSDHVRWFQRASLVNGFSLFDKNATSLSLYYGLWIPESIWNWNRIGILRPSYLGCALNLLKKEPISYVDYLRCQQCDVVFHNYPHETRFINEHYRRYYRRVGGKLFGRANSPNDYHVRWKELVASQFLKIANLSLSARILDVGCAEGCFCLALGKMGMEAYGIDPAEPMIHYANDVLSLENVKCGIYDEAAYEPEYFDAIHCFHVLEHILNIDTILRAMHLHLKPAGMLALSVPSVDLARKDADFDRVLGFDHIYSFSEKWFETYLPRYGFTILEIFQSPFNMEELGPDNPGKEFNVSEIGDPRV